METNNLESQPITNSQMVSVKTEKSRLSPFVIINLLIGSVAALAILLLVAVSLISRSNLVSNSWNGIIPGKTTKTEVVGKLGSPQEDIPEPFGQSLIYPSGIKALPNTVIYDKTTNVVLGTLVSVSDENQAKQYYQEMQKMGKPEKVTYGTYLQFSKIYIFASKGITYSANENTKMVDGFQYYVPTKLDNYLSQFGKFFSDQNPSQF